MVSYAIDKRARTPDSVLTVICLRSHAGFWQLLACRVLPGLAVAAAVRPNAVVERGHAPATSVARPTHLAPGCTLAQPLALLPTLVGSYPTVSSLTRTPRYARGRWRACFLLRL